MINQLFRNVRLRPNHAVLDPGTGTGVLIEGIIRWCKEREVTLPRIVGVESDPRLVSEARKKFGRHPTVEIRHEDFLISDSPKYDFVIANPPYVPITGLSVEERWRYRARYETAQGRFDLYLLFFEQGLRCLTADGRLVFITPEKFLYVETAAPLRRLLCRVCVEEIRLVDEDTFGDLVTYPTITTVSNRPPRSRTLVTRRDGRISRIVLPGNGDSWLPALNGDEPVSTGSTLGEICTRVSCGVATGADAVFVLKTEHVAPHLLPFAYPTIAGRELDAARVDFHAQYSMLIPYSRRGELLPENALGALRGYLHNSARHSQLIRRTCVARKPWYAFHETPPLPDILRPKILCKDIAQQPRFWINSTGDLVPRHSVYYIVPRNPKCLEELCTYLNSEVARNWLAAHCQRAANGFLRLQSHVLKRLPVPTHFAAAGLQGRQTRHAARTAQLALPLRSRDAHAV